jgi:hypothetical protein
VGVETLNKADEIEENAAPAATTIKNPADQPNSPASRGALAGRSEY